MGGLETEDRLQMFIKLSIWSCWAVWFNQLVRLDRIFEKINTLLHRICKCAKQREKINTLEYFGFKMHLLPLPALDAGIISVAT